MFFLFEKIEKKITQREWRCLKETCRKKCRSFLPTIKMEALPAFSLRKRSSKVTAEFSYPPTVLTGPQGCTGLTGWHIAHCTELCLEHQALGMSVPLSLYRPLSGTWSKSKTCSRTCKPSRGIPFIWGEDTRPQEAQVWRMALQGCGVNGCWRLVAFTECQALPHFPLSLWATTPRGTS